MPRSTPPSYARWMLTVNNPPIGSYDTYFKVDEHLKFAIWQLEAAPTTGTFHLQSYLELKQRLAKSTMISLYPGCHVQKCDGKQSQCIAYVTKEETKIEGPWSVGRQARPGTRTDINTIRDKVIDGVSNKEIIMNDELHPTYSRLYRYVSHLRLELSVDRDFRTKVISFWGPTGIGKSETAHKLMPNAYMFSNSHGCWFDGYNGTANVIFDDFKGNIPRHFLLQLCDKYGTKVESKGGMINWAPKNIIFTSSKPPWEWYHDKEGNNIPWLEIERRIAEVYTEPIPDISMLSINI